MKEEVVRDKGWDLLVHLFKTAKADRSISFDEERILRSADDNIVKLLEYVREAWDDRGPNESEKQKITFLIKKIHDDARTLAEYDDIVTEEERKMLDDILEKMNEFLSLTR